MAQELFRLQLTDTGDAGAIGELETGQLQLALSTPCGGIWVTPTPNLRVLAPRIQRKAFINLNKYSVRDRISSRTV